MIKYVYLFLGVLLGLGIALYYFGSIQENKQKFFSTTKLDETMRNIVEKIQFKIGELKRELTEDEKNEIIEQCLKQNFSFNK